MTTMTDPKTVTPTPKPLLPQKLETMDTAWAQLAPEVLFGNVTRAEFEAATNPSIAARAVLETFKVNLSALASDRLAKETALKAMLKRVASAVRTDAKYGDNSGLYRAMGFVPSSERKAPSKAGEPAIAKPAKVSVSLVDRFTKMVAAWQGLEIDPSQDKIGGLSLQNWKPAGDALLQVINSIHLARAGRSLAVNSKNECDATTRQLMKKVAAGVLSADGYGENSALYRAMGFIPANERKRSTARAKAPAVTQ